MDTLAQLESYSNELSMAVKGLTYARGTDGKLNPANPILIDPEAHPEVHQAKQSFLLNVAEIKTLVYRPTNFLKHLANKVCSFSLLKHYNLP
jgi:hypothetical protein